MNPRTYPAFARAAPIAAAAAALVSALCLWLAAVVLAPPAQAALSPSAYSVGALCSAPPPGYAGCLGLRLVANQPLSLRGARASTHPAHAARGVRPDAERSPEVERIEFDEPWEGSLSPQNVLTAYSLSGLPAPATQQTLALVDAFDDPTAEHDLQVFDEQFHLPTCTTANGCFTKVEMRGGPENTLPEAEPGWAQEIATDVEVAHGICQSCKIMLVEAHSNEDVELEAAEEEAERRGATEISNSWGGSEHGITPAEDEASAFNHPGTVITAAAGDDGYLNWDASASSNERGFPDYPASSPQVVAVGGTRLGLTAGGAWKEETVWNGDGASGGGCSTVLTAPAWQQSVADWGTVGCGTYRAVADVSADADPYTGVAVYDSTPIVEEGTEWVGWVTIGGTSVASPTIAATFALAGGAGKEESGETVKYPAQTLYENLTITPGSLHDVTLGSNGKCGKPFNKNTGTSGCSNAEEGASCSATAICLAGPGYDGPTGVGTPDGIAAFTPNSAEAKRKSEERRLAEEKLREEQRTEREREAKKSEEEAERGSSSGNGSGGGGVSESQPLAAPSGVPFVSAAPLTEPLATSGSSIVPILSAPALTRTATAAVSRGGRPKVSQIAFTFTLNVAARVKVTLAKQVTQHVRKHWRTLPYSLTIAGIRGRDSAHLSAHGTLAPGRYRLTLAPAHGTARSLTFQIA